MNDICGGGGIVDFDANIHPSRDVFFELSICLHLSVFHGMKRRICTRVFVIFLCCFGIYIYEIKYEFI